MRLNFIGAARTVTGSCFLAETGEEKFLVDCGMFQGAKRIRELNYEEFPFNPAEIDFVLLTHAHIDHCGLLPKLVKNGFKGKIYATKSTASLVGVMLPDSAHIQESDAQIMNRKGQRRGEEPIEPLYLLDDVKDTLNHLQTVNYNEQIQISDTVSVTYRDAGHILGSAILELVVKENDKSTKIVFSGDLGQPDQPILRNPAIISGADFLVTESTYGDRVHQFYDKETALLELINDTMDRGGNLIIPAFAVGRTQTLLYHLYNLHKAGRLDNDIPIILDSPLAIAATRVFMENSHEFDEEAVKLLQNGKIPDFPQLKIFASAVESRSLNTAESSAIIISASGMADAGRVLHHLKHNLWRPESTVLFVGYQAEGSLGRRLIDGIKRVRVLGEEVAVKAKIESLDGFSAHADANQIIEWASHIKDPLPAKVFIVHGETPSAESLKDLFDKKLGIEAYIPFRGDTVKIGGRASEIIQSTIKSVSVEMEMEEILRDFDSDYRQMRKRILQLVVHQPKLLEPMIKAIAKARKYIKKVFSSYNI